MPKKPPTPKKLYTTSEIAKRLGVNRRALQRAVESHRIEAPAYVAKIGPAGKTYLWTAGQYERIEEKAYFPRAYDHLGEEGKKEFIDRMKARVRQRRARARGPKPAPRLK